MLSICNMFLYAYLLYALYVSFLHNMIYVNCFLCEIYRERRKKIEKMKEIMRQNKRPMRRAFCMYKSNQCSDPPSLQSALTQRSSSSAPASSLIISD